MANQQPIIDVTVENHGSIVLLRPITSNARAWIDENVAWEQSFGNAIVVEPRYVGDIVIGLIEAGFVVRG